MKDDGLEVMVSRFDIVRCT